VVLAFASFARPASAEIAINWINWTAPSSYPEMANFVNWGIPDGDYTYASSASGTVSTPDTSLVTATLAGEVVNPTSWAWATADSIYGAPTGFASVPGTTTPNYWSTRPATNSSTYTSANATPPTNGDHRGLVGRGALSPSIAVSSPVSNVVMTIYSLGASGVPASWDFNQDFVILSDTLGASSLGFAGSGLTKSLVDGKYRLSGSEGAGIIQFLGSFSPLDWTVSAPEAWSSWTSASRSQSPNTPPTPWPSPVWPAAAISCGGVASGPDAK
jgi:hypothetical protein